MPRAAHAGRGPGRRSSQEQGRTAIGETPLGSGMHRPQGSREHPPSGSRVGRQHEGRAGQTAGADRCGHGTDRTVHVRWRAGISLLRTRVQVREGVHRACELCGRQQQGEAEQPAQVAARPVQEAVLGHAGFEERTIPADPSSANLVEMGRLECAGHDYMGTAHRRLAASVCDGFVQRSAVVRRPNILLRLPGSWHLFGWRSREPRWRSAAGRCAIRQQPSSLPTVRPCGACGTASRASDPGRTSH